MSESTGQAASQAGAENAQAGGESQDGQNAGNAGQAEALTYDNWVGEQSDEVKAMLTDHTSGLKTALGAERDVSKGLRDNIRTLATKEEGERNQALEDLTNQMTEREMQSEFYVSAHTAGVKNLELAFIAAKHADLFDKRGNANFAKLKEIHPELFAVVQGLPTGAGAGGDNNNRGEPSFDDVLRNAAKR